MTDKPLIIGCNEVECAVLRRAFGNSGIQIMRVGELTGHGHHTCLIVTPNVDVRDEWFRTCALPRLAPGGEVFVIRPEWHAPFFG